MPSFPSFTNNYGRKLQIRLLYDRKLQIKKLIFRKDNRKVSKLFKTERDKNFQNRGVHKKRKQKL